MKTRNAKDRDVNYLLRWVMDRLGVKPAAVSRLTGVPFLLIRNAYHYGSEPQARNAVAIVAALKRLAAERPDRGINPDILTVDYIWNPSNYASPGKKKSPTGYKYNASNSTVQPISAGGAP